MRRLTVVAATVLTFTWSALFNGRLGIAWGLPDVYFYIDMALGRFDLVREPFNARPLAPLLARWIAAALHARIETGFAALAYLSLFWTLGVVFWLLARSRAPQWTLLAVAAVPFWPQLLRDAGLPDPLYAALLASLLLALECHALYTAAALMLPLMLARESTTLTLACLLAVGWRQLRWVPSLLAATGVGVGAQLVRRLSAGSLPNPEHLSGALYMAGKILSNTSRSLGFIPWSNVYPELCAEPRWRIPLHLGPLSSIGVCAWSPASPSQALLALLVSFGALPWLLFARRGGLKTVFTHGNLLMRFCIVYGGLSFVLAPSLGTWYARLFGYGWPLFLVAAPRLLLGSAAVSTRGRAELAWLAWLGLHLLLCNVGALGTYRFPSLLVVLLQLAAIALVLVHRRTSNQVGPDLEPGLVRGKI